MQSGEVSWAAGDLGLASWPWPLGHWGVGVKRLAVSVREGMGCSLVMGRLAQSQVALLPLPPLVQGLEIRC